MRLKHKKKVFEQIVAYCGVKNLNYRRYVFITAMFRGCKHVSVNPVKMCELGITYFVTR